MSLQEGNGGILPIYGVRYCLPDSGRVMEEKLVGLSIKRL